MLLLLRFLLSDVGVLSWPWAVFECGLRPVRCECYISQTASVIQTIDEMNELIPRPLLLSLLSYLLSSPIPFLQPRNPSTTFDRLCITKTLQQPLLFQSRLPHGCNRDHQRTYIHARWIQNFTPTDNNDLGTTKDLAHIDSPDLSTY